MRRYALSAALVLLLCFGLPFPASADNSGNVLALADLAAAGYDDVPDGHWSADSVTQATNLGIFQGVSGGVFGLGQPISRAAFVTAMVRLFDWETVLPEENSFTDVTEDRWFYSAVETALANGGIAAADSEFRPTENITREEMVSMLLRGLGYTSLAGIASNYGTPFTDVSTNKGFVTVAYDMGIVSGVWENLFDPSGLATREQAATLLMRVYDRLSRETVQLEDAEGYQAVTVETPAAKEGDDLPTTPLEPLTELYNTLRQLKNSGTNMEQVALCLTGGGVRTVNSPDGGIEDTDWLTSQEVEELIQTEGVNTYYSDRYESAYCLYQTVGGQTAVVWYQSDESLAAKLQLACLFDVTNYVLV